jgi:acetyl-CoA synthetase
MTTTPSIHEIAYRPDEAMAASTNVQSFMDAHDIDTRAELRHRAADDVEWFWDTIPEYLGIDFYEEYDAVRDDSDGPQFTDWYVGGELNVAHNVVDRHARPDSPDRNTVACLWEGEPGDVREVTYHELHRQSNRVANYLESVGVTRGDTVGLYMPMVPAVISILYGCLKVGAIAVPIFSGFGRDATATRIDDSACSVLFTGDGFYRRGDEVRLKETADEAIAAAGHVEHTVVYDRFGSQSSGDLPWDDGRDAWWDEAIATQASTYETTSVPSDHPAMLLYSSGTTGEPKGIVQTHAGVQMQCAKELYFNFDHKPHDRFFWVSDIGWMMGPWTLIGNHTFGGTIFMYEGAPDHPEPDRYWEMIDRHGLTVFGISPTAIRALREYDDEYVHRHDLSSLRLLGSTGEPWDPESWQWFFETVGRGEAPIINISGGTEICGCFLMPLPGEPLKPCSLGGPGLGMDIDIVDDDGESIADTNERGYLVARDSCPSMTKSLWSGDDRYLEEYWSRFEGLWNHGDWAQMDEDGYWFLHGRADDALNVAGRKVGPAEIEGVLIEHEAVSQAAAVGVSDETTGTAVAAYVVLEPDATPSEPLREELRTLVGAEHGKPFRPRDVRFVPALPKTQSGKIIRRAIASIADGEDVGDLSSIENPDSLEAIEPVR